MESESVAAAMIRRFREAKPTSRAERDSAKLSGRVREMWWVDDENNGRTGRSLRAPSRNFEKHDTSMELEYPRPSPLKPTVGRPPARISSTMKSIDDLIMKDIMGTSDSLDWDTHRKTVFGGDDLDKSTEFVAGSRSGPAYRYDGGRDGAVNFRKSGEALLNESLETVGKIGFHGLNAPDLKLDGANDQKAVGVSAGQMQDVNASLEELLKTLGANKENVTKEGFPESIMQVYNDVNANLIGFKSKFEERYEKEDAEEKMRAERDEEMKKIGREEERENMLKQITKMELENRSRIAKQAETFDSSTTVDSDSECLNTSAEVDDAPVDQQVHNLRSALQIRMRHLEKLHADAMKDTFAPNETTLTETESLQEAANAAEADISKVEKRSLLYGLAKDPFLNIPSRHARDLQSSHKSSRSHSVSRRMGQRKKNDIREVNDNMTDGRRSYISPDPTSGSAPGILHDSVVSAAKYITVNLNVAMDGLHQRLPNNIVSTASVAPPAVEAMYTEPPRYAEITGDTSGPRLPGYSEMQHIPGTTISSTVASSVAPPAVEAKEKSEPPSYAEVTGDMSGPRLPTYSEIYQGQQHDPPTPKLPTYDEVVDPSCGKRHPAVPSPRFVPPLSEAEKMTMEIDRVLGPTDSSVEETELAWWRLNDANAKESPGTVTPENRNKNVFVGDTKSHRQSKPWLVTPSHERSVHSVRPSAPVFPLPDPPVFPERASAVFGGRIQSTRDFHSLPSYLATGEPIKYHTAREGLAVRSVRSDDARREKLKTESFSPEAPTLVSPTSVAVGDVSWSERELYLKKMQHYRATLSSAVL